jgi:GNAT superfamily N-acetyltransferase
MRFTVEPSPSGGYFVRVAGVDAPVSRHDTEEEAEAAAASYRRGVEGGREGELVALRDGREVLIRPVRPEDEPLFAARITELDHVDHEAIGALDPETGDRLGVARYMRHADRPHAAEAAVSVIDSMQGCGLGRVLLTRLTHRAAQNGVRCFTASLLTSNHSMLRLFEKLGKVTVTARRGAETEIDVELPLSDPPTLELMLRSAATGHVRRQT